MMKKIIIASLCILFSVGTFAQKTEKQELTPNKEYKVGGFGDNWFLSIGVGVQTYFSEYYTAGSVVDHFSPAIDISLGKWLTPSMGVRGQLSGLNLRGYNMLNTPYVDASNMEDGAYKMNFKYFNLHADFLLNLHSRFARYNTKRCYELIPFVGMGWFGVLRDGGLADNEFAANAGIINQFRINDRLDFDVELKAIIARSAIDGNPAKRINVPASATIGLTYKIGSSTEFHACEYSQTPIIEKTEIVQNNAEEQAKIDHLNKSLAEQQRLNNDANKALLKEKQKVNELQEEVDALKNQTVPKVSTKIAVKVYFEIGQAKLDKLNEANLEYFADLIKNSNNQYAITGYADSNTGSKSVNEALANKRAEYVYKQLTEKYGINKNLLSIKSDVVGGSTNPELVRMAEIK